MGKYRQKISVYGRDFPVTVVPKTSGYFLTLHWHNRIDISTFSLDVGDGFKELERIMRGRLSKLAKSCEIIKKSVNQRDSG